MPRHLLIALLFCFIQLSALGFNPPNPLGFNPRVQALAFMFPAQAQLIFDAAHESNTYLDQFFGAVTQNQNDTSSNDVRH